MFDYIYDTSGKAVAGAKVTSTLNFSGASDTSPIVNIGPLQQTTLTDSNGYWQFNLVPNPALTPTGTSYTIATPYNSYSISVPNSAGPFQSSSILVNVPSVLSPAVTGLTGPITVTGNETVTGNLTVSGTTTLAGVNTGSLAATGNSSVSGNLSIGGNVSVGGSTSALTVGGDLTIASAFRLLFGASISKLVGGATSFSIRNNADTQDNLLITNAGLVTLRNTLTVPSAGIILGLGATVGPPTTGTFSAGQYYTDPNGATFVCVAGGTPGTWVVINSGRYHAEVFQGTNQSGLTAGNANVINYDTILSDPMSGYTTGQYKVPIAGRWRVTFTISVGSVGSGVASFASVYRNGAEYARVSDFGSGNTGNKSQGGSAIVRCTSTTDILQLIWFPGSGGPFTLTGGSTLNWATFEYVGPN